MPNDFPPKTPGDQQREFGTEFCANNNVRMTFFDFDLVQGLRVVILMDDKRKLRAAFVEREESDPVAVG